MKPRYFQVVFHVRESVMEVKSFRTHPAQTSGVAKKGAHQKNEVIKHPGQARDDKCATE